MSHTKTHHDSKSDNTYSSESIVHELKNRNTQEAAREFNRDLHSSKDFNEIYKKANEQISKYNQTHKDQLPALELVDEHGKATTKDGAKGIKIADTTYGTDTVRNNTTVDDKTGNKTVRNGDSVKTLNKDGDQVQTDPEGRTTTTFSPENKHTDHEIGTLKSVTKDGKGHTTLTGENGTKTIDDVTGKQVLEYPNGDRKVERPDGSGCTITKDNGVTKIHSWGNKDEGNYDVTVNPNGDYEKTMAKKDWFGNKQTEKGNGYKYQPDEE